METGKNSQVNVVRNYQRYLKLQRGFSPNTLEAYQRDLQKLLVYLEREGKDAKTLSRIIKSFDFTITDTYGIDRAQVSAGGVPTSEVDPESFQSRFQKGLYVMGELNDVDGICGGYNLHLAWASAILASEKLKGKR